MNEIEQFFKLLKEQEQQQKDFVLVTITASSGSVPRGAGARMVVNETGRLFGTIGGGAIEHQVEKEALKALAEKNSCLKHYDLSANEADLGMICGGAVTVYIQYFSVTNPQTDRLSTLCDFALSCMEENSALWLYFRLGESRASFNLFSPRKGWADGFGDVPLASPQKSDDCYVEQIFAGAVVHIFGGGHVARELVPILSHTGFSCVVYDDREEFLKKEQFPEAKSLVKVNFENLTDSLSEAEESYFVIMTRGHQYDLLVQKFALRCPAVYIGVMGSRKKIETVSKKLLSLGFTTEDLKRINTPIGLSIGAETPAEIAVSIAAELIKTRGEKR